MNKLILFLGLILASIFLPKAGNAQEGEPILLDVTYEFIHVNDTNNRDKQLVEKMLLELGQTGSKYWRAPRTKPRTEPSVPAGVHTVQAVGKPLAVVHGPGFTAEELFQYPAKGKMNIAAGLGMQDYLMEFSLPKIDWKISEETKTIEGYTCQKAVGAYGGRNYTAWFANDLPFQNGPWKLSGLPGLILEATDAKKEVLFICKEISKDTAARTTATSYRRLVKVTEKAFNRAKEAFYQDPASAMQAQLPAGTPTVQVVYRDGSGKSVIGDNATILLEKSKKDAKTQNNNPLELDK